MDGLRRTGWQWIAAGLMLVSLAGCGGSNGRSGSTAPATTAPAGAGSSQATSSSAASSPASSTESTSSPAAATSTAPAGGATSAAGTDRCHTADLSGRLRALNSAAGQRYDALVLTNRSTRTCRIFGYGGVQLVDSARRPLPTQQVRDPAFPPRLVSLRPGASAWSRLHWGVVPSGTESQTGPCEPTPAYLLVIPPDEHTALSVTWSFGAVCQRGRIEQTAYAAGTGPAF